MNNVGIENMELYMQRAIQQMEEPETYAYQEVPQDDIAVDIIDTVVDYGGAWWILGFAALGALGIFKKRIKQWLQT